MHSYAGFYLCLSPLSGPSTMSVSIHLLCLITTWTSVSAELHLDHDTELDSKVSI